MQPHDLELFRQPGAPAPHPNGTWAAIAISRPDLTADAYHSQLWHLDTESGALKPLTSGAKDTAPAISPDGEWLAFLRATDKTPQVYLAPVNEHGLAAEPRRVTDHPLGAQGPLRFDGHRLAYLAPVPEEGRYGTDPDVGPGKEPPRHITNFTYRTDGRGFYLDRPTHVFTIDVTNAALDPLASAPEPKAEKPALGGTGITPEQLTYGSDGFSSPTWFDGDLLALRANRDALHSDLVRISPAGETATVELPHLETEGASGTWTVHALAADPGDPRKLWMLLADYGPDRMDFIGRMGALASARLSGAAIEQLTIHSDPRTSSLSADVFEAASDGVYVARENRGTVELARFDGETLTTAFEGTVAVSAGAALAGGGALIVAATSTSPGEVFRIDDGARQLTDLSRRLLAEVEFFEPEDVVIHGPDGYPVHGWVTTPSGPGPHPVLLLIHGGPHAAYTPTFFDEVQVYTRAGYAVVFCNPRGSSSYGQDHGRAITGVWGTLDSQDIMAFLDGVLASRADLDAGRVGVLGGSYGGYMTAWLTTRSGRWAGAIVERGFLDAFSFEGSSDIGWFFGRRYLGEDPEVVAAQNPMSHIDEVQTPTLVIHSEEDWRCPIEQGQRWFVGLKRRGVHAEFLVFSGEGHELSRSGTPKHRVARFEHILKWWATHLPTAANPAEPAAEPQIVDGKDRS